MEYNQFMYSLEDEKGTNILGPTRLLDTIVKYLDENVTNAVRYRVSLIRTGLKDIVLYTRTESLPDVTNETVRNVFAL